MSMPKSLTVDRPAPKPSFVLRVRRALFQPRALLVLAGLGVVAVMGPQWLAARPDLSQRPEYRLVTTDIRISDPPHWVPPDFVEQVVKRSQLPETVCLLDDGVLEHIAAAFAAHPWVERVRCVRKSAGEGIVVELDYRRPVAMVNVKQGVYPVDAAGILLPPGDFSPADVSRYPAVLNVTSIPQGAPGTAWGDVTVTGAAGLASVLTRTQDGEESPWKRLRLAAILVPDRTEAEPAADELTYQLLTPGQSRIVWGRAPGSDHPGELSDEQKIGRLDKYCQDFGGFDQSHAPYEIDIRHWQEISRRPLGLRSATRE